MIVLVLSFTLCASIMEHTMINNSHHSKSLPLNHRTEATRDVRSERETRDIQRPTDRLTR